MKHAETMASVHGLTHLFEGSAAKPDIVVDDMPGTVLNPFVFNPDEEPSWTEMVNTIIETHID